MKSILTNYIDMKGIADFVYGFGVLLADMGKQYPW